MTPGHGGEEVGDPFGVGAILELDLNRAVVGVDVDRGGRRLPAAERLDAEILEARQRQEEADHACRRLGAPADRRAMETPKCSATQPKRPLPTAIPAKVAV